MIFFHNYVFLIVGVCIFKQFSHELRLRALLHLAETHALFGVRDEQVLLGTGDRHLEEAAFLLEFLGASVFLDREERLLDTCDEDAAEFKSFCAVHRHEGYLVVIIRIAVGIAQKHDVLEIARQRALLPEFLREIPVPCLEVLGLVLD